jgi:hypothetical protein
LQSLVSSVSGPGGPIRHTGQGVIPVRLRTRPGTHRVRCIPDHVSDTRSRPGMRRR